MKYDSKKTLSENKILINESNGVSWTADKAYELDVDWQIGSEFIQKGFYIQKVSNDRVCRNGKCVDVFCPGPSCYASGKQTKKPKSDAFSPDNGFIFYFMCPTIHGEWDDVWGKPMRIHYNEEGSDFFPHVVTNAALQSKLTSVFCTPKVNKDVERTSEIELTPEMIKYMLQSGNYDLPIEYKDSAPVEKKETIPIQKSQEEINKEILARKDAPDIAPRLYVASKGFKDWKNYQKQCCCPTYSENKEEHLQCNKNIARAVEQGWNPKEGGCPELAKNKYCKGNANSAETEFGMEGSGKSLGDPDKTGSDVKLDDSNQKSIIATEPKPFHSRDVGFDGTYEPEFNGGTSEFENWLSDNLWNKTDLFSKNEMDKISQLVFKFDVGIDGKVSNFKLEVLPIEGKSITKLKNNDKIIDVLEKMPNWIPAEKDGVKLQSSVEYPIMISY
jgi:hypothetical protein